MSSARTEDNPQASTRTSSRRGDATADTILRATYRLLESKGYDAVTTEDIAAEAKVSKATIYRTWDSKQQLFVAAARAHLGAVVDEDLGSFREEIRSILSQRLEDYRDPGTLRLVASLVGAATADPELAPFLSDWIELLSRSLRQVIQRGIARGDVAYDVDIFALESLIAGVLSRAVVAQHAFSPSTLDSLVDLIAAAVSPAKG